MHVVGNVKERLYSMDPRVMLANERCRSEVTVRRSRIEPESAGNGLFADRSFVKRDVIRSYYGSLVYAELGQSLYSRKSTREVYMEVAAKSLRT